MKTSDASRAEVIITMKRRCILHYKGFTKNNRRKSRTRNRWQTSPQRSMHWYTRGIWWKRLYTPWTMLQEIHAYSSWSI